MQFGVIYKIYALHLSASLFLIGLVFTLLKRLDFMNQDKDTN